MSNTINITIDRINKKNYHKFNDMVYWRINGVEKSYEEKEKNKKTIFKEVYKELEHEGFYVYAAKYNEKFIGWISLMYIPKIGKWHKGVIYVDELWTVPKFRRKGVAYKLMNKAKELEKELGAVTTRLYTDNIIAQKLYEKCGLEVTNNAVFMERIQ
ncbi:MAG: GNAT family N-acetyltransferase [Firmicutes bacterium]|nr:GNAT family N-acetyltransferase [Bacillota bacterium]